VYDIWNTPADTPKPFYGKPKPERMVVRKPPSALPAIELPGTESSYNPSKEVIEEIAEKVESKVLKRQLADQKLERAIHPSKIRTVKEIIQSLPKVSENELMKIKKQAKKGRRKGSKPKLLVTDKNFSTKFSRTERNKQKRRKLQLNLERKILMEKKRHKDMDNVDKYVSAAEDTNIRAKKRREALISRRKSSAFKMKNLKHRYVSVPKISILRRIPAGSLRNLKPGGNEFLERSARYEKRNMVIV
jgi:hypothetical protein